ncbi:MAG: DUF1800 domain-containing protein [Planctomycetota bacterium]
MTARETAERPNGARTRRPGRVGSVFLAGAVAFAAACSSGDEDAPEGPWWEQAGPGQDLPVDDPDAARFLTQATFGPTMSEMTGLNFAGFDAWFAYQRSLPPTQQRPRLQARAAAGQDLFKNQRQEEWWRAVVRGEDQLRQRMAFALSEIFVISDEAGALGNQILGVAEYYDMLSRHALGNYRELLEDVSKSPAMGRYLSHLGNRKLDPETGIRPDENYAREIMQLFTIGLIELNSDGTPRLDNSMLEIPTYDQTDIEELSRVMTGWTYGGATRFNNAQANFLRPMEPWDEFHDDGAKTIVGDALLVAGLTAEEDLDAALDVLFEHPNTGPFISRRLIQRLVTSNPSPEYIQRVATVFADDGEGVRGNLYAVARAILMDDEARSGHLTSPTTFGMVREPLVRLAGLWRFFNGTAQTGRFRYSNPENDFEQAALRSPTVFNFFEPDYAPPGEVADAGLVAPEMQITTHTSVTKVANEFRDRILNAYPGRSNNNEHTVVLNLDDELALADDPAALIDHLDLYLMSGQMSNQMRTALIDHVTSTELDAGNKADGMQRVLDAIYLIVTSPEGAIQL